MKNADKIDKRFNMLLDSYAVGYYLSHKLLDSGILQSKVRVGGTAKEIEELAKRLNVAFANDLRDAELAKESIKSIENHDHDYLGSAVDLANTYFEELSLRGDEWVHADLRSLFSNYQLRAQRQLEMDRSY